MIKVSIDLMGGEFAPHSILEAISGLDAHFILVGDKKSKDLIQKYDIKNYTYLESTTVIPEGTRISASDAEQSSMYKAILEVKEGRADVVISGGPTGYYLMLARKHLGTIEEITRAAITAIVPTKTGKCIMMDLGANITCTSQDLVEFAIIGKALAKYWLKKPNPKVGFINVGSELGKGPEQIKQAAQNFAKLTNSEQDFVEGHQIMQGTHDVAIIDGFTGNCLLKFGEGVSKYLGWQLSQTFKKNLFLKLVGLLVRKKIKKEILDARKYNGGLLAGINGCVIKSHGSADSTAFKHATKFGIELAKCKSDWIAEIEKDLKELKQNNYENEATTQ